MRLIIRLLAVLGTDAVNFKSKIQNPKSKMKSTCCTDSP